MSYQIHFDSKDHKKKLALNWTRKLTLDMHAEKLSAMPFLFYWNTHANIYWIALLKAKTFHLASIFKECEWKWRDERREERNWKCVFAEKSAGSWNQEEETFLFFVSVETSSLLLFFLLFAISPSSVSNYFSMNVDLAFMLPLSKRRKKMWRWGKDSAVSVISAADATLACAVAINQLKERERENGRSVLYWFTWKARREWGVESCACYWSHAVIFQLHFLAHIFLLLLHLYYTDIVSK